MPIFVSKLQLNELALPIDEPGEYFASVAGIDAGLFLGLPSTASFLYATIDDDQKPDLQIQRRGSVVDVATSEYAGPIELVISNGIDSESVARRVVNDLSEGLSLELNTQEDWVFQARKVLSDTSVSVYSNQYLLEADK